ncbi:ABC transporter substrate-binding protein [Hydrogenophaga borbori]|uniref:ABC transporter substrate-binding protein n=1 Tax=Hydrogenophaga borbori TaxID=2294117 RepID=UPI00301B9072
MNHRPLPFARLATSLALGLTCLAPLPAAAADQVITIGLVNPRTGPFSALGQAARRGIDLALADAKSNPALAGVTFKVVERDSAAKVADAVRYARELESREGVDVLMGGLSSAECLALQQFAGEEKLPYVVASGCWVDDFGAPGHVNRYSFRTTPSNKQRNVAFVSWLTQNVGKRWYVMYSDTAYGQSGLKAFKEAGADVVGSVGVPFGATDMAAYVSKVDRNADGVYFVFAGRDATLALQEALSQGLGQRLKLAGMQSLVIPEAFPKLPQATEGLVYIGSYPREASGPLDTPHNRAFQKKYATVAPNEPVALNAVEAYVATNALLKAIEQSGFRGRRDADKLVSALESLNAPASAQFPAGPLSMRKEDRQAVVPLYIGTVKDGKETVIHMVPAADVGKIR